MMQKPPISNIKSKGAIFCPGEHCRLGLPFQFSAFRFPLSAFTLIELLIVIAIISILAALVIPVAGTVNRSKIRAKARGELERVATGIDLYKAKLGHYPPDSPGYPASSQLYFELFGTTLTNLSGKPTYVTLDGSSRVAASDVSAVFGPGVGGFINTSRTGAGDESRPATAFLNNLKPDESVAVTNPAPNTYARFFVAAVPAPPGTVYYVSYVSSNPTNNPNSYDLWVDVLIGGKTYRISNWTKEVVAVP
jgi:prepilin-type N-terminal cleavage/methylation domain-containing protein